MITRYRFAYLTSTAAFMLLIAGGLVTSTGSALAVPDWPLAYGQFFPPMVGGILFEHGHRIIAGLVAILTWVLAVWTWRSDERPWVRGVAAAAAGGILLQAVLGGLTVLFKLPAPISVSHACLGQTIFCLLLIITQATSPWYLSVAPHPPLSPKGRGTTFESLSLEGRGQGEGNLWKWGVFAIVFVYIQLIFGAIVRHSPAGIGLHMAGALFATIALGMAIYKGITARDSKLARPAALLSGLIPAQLVLGLSSLVVRVRPPLRTDFWRTALPTAHVAIGAAILGTLVVWSLRAYRLQPGESREESHVA